MRFNVSRNDICGKDFKRPEKAHTEKDRWSYSSPSQWPRIKCYSKAKINRPTRLEKSELWILHRCQITPGI